jgi:hypothetical protein
MGSAMKRSVVAPFTSVEGMMKTVFDNPRAVPSLMR